MKRSVPGARSQAARWRRAPDARRTARERSARLVVAAALEPPGTGHQHGTRTPHAV